MPLNKESKSNQATILNTDNLHMVMGIKYSYLIQIILKHIFDPLDRTLTSTINSDQSGPESINIEGTLYTSQNSKTGASPPDAV